MPDDKKNKKRGLSEKTKRRAQTLIGLQLSAQQPADTTVTAPPVTTPEQSTAPPTQGFFSVEQPDIRSRYADITTERRDQTAVAPPTQVSVPKYKKKPVIVGVNPDGTYKTANTRETLNTEEVATELESQQLEPYQNRPIDMTNINLDTWADAVSTNVANNVMRNMGFLKDTPIGDFFAKRTNQNTALETTLKSITQPLARGLLQMQKGITSLTKDTGKEGWSWDTEAKDWEITADLIKDMANIVLGASTTAVGLIPQMTAMNALYPHMEGLIEESAKPLMEAPQAKQLAQQTAHILSLATFGKPVFVAGMMSSTAGEFMGSLVEHSDLDEETQALLVQLSHEAGFWGGLGLYKPGAKAYQNAVKKLREIKPALTDPGVNTQQTGEAVLRQEIEKEQLQVTMTDLERDRDMLSSAINQAPTIEKKMELIEQRDKISAKIQEYRENLQKKEYEPPPIILNEEPRQPGEIETTQSANENAVRIIDGQLKELEQKLSEVRTPDELAELERQYNELEQRKQKWQERQKPKEPETPPEPTPEPEAPVTTTAVVKYEEPGKLAKVEKEPEPTPDKTEPKEPEPEVPEGEINTLFGTEREKADAQNKQPPRGRNFEETLKAGDPEGTQAKKVTTPEGKEVTVYGDVPEGTDTYSAYRFKKSGNIIAHKGKAHAGELDQVMRRFGSNRTRWGQDAWRTGQIEQGIIDANGKFWKSAEEKKLAEYEAKVKEEKRLEQERIKNITSKVNEATDTGEFENSDMVPEVAVPLSRIKVDLSKFQNRDAPYSAKTVERLTSNFEPLELDPIRLWKDPTDNQYYILAGHSRFEVFKRLRATTNDPKFDKIPAKIYAGKTLAEAKAYARERSNNNQDAEALSERAKLYREKREQGQSEKDIIKEARTNEHKNANVVLDLSHLDPRGRTINMFNTMQQTGTEGRNIANQAVAYIAGAKRVFKELTNAHEDEMYSYLIDKGNIEQFRNKTDFIDKLDKIIGKIDFDAKKPLGLDENLTKHRVERTYDEEINALRTELKDAEKVLAYKRDQFLKARENPKDPISQLSDKEYQDRVDSALKNYEHQVQLIKRELIRKEATKKDAVKEAEQSEISLFDQPVDEVRYNEAKQEIRDALSKPGDLQMMGLQKLGDLTDRKVLKAVYDVGRYLIQQGVTKLSEFAKRMTEQVGNWIKPMAREIWNELNKDRSGLPGLTKMGIGGKDAKPDVTESTQKRIAKVIDGFYLTSEKKLLELRSEKQSAQKWLNNQLITKEEMDMVGLTDYLKNKKPYESVSKSELLEVIETNRPQIEVIRYGVGHSLGKYTRYTMPGTSHNYTEILVTLPDNPMAKHDIYQSGHWNERNVLLHLRVSERKDKAGKNMLFIEEVQSDWGEQGRRVGFKGESHNVPEDIANMTPRQLADEKRSLQDNVMERVREEFALKYDKERAEMVQELYLQWVIEEGKEGTNRIDLEKIMMNTGWSKEKAEQFMNGKSPYTGKQVREFNHLLEEQSDNMLATMKHPLHINIQKNMARFVGYKDLLYYANDGKEISPGRMLTVLPKVDARYDATRGEILVLVQDPQFLPKLKQLKQALTTIANIHHLQWNQASAILRNYGSRQSKIQVGENSEIYIYHPDNHQRIKITEAPTPEIAQLVKQILNDAELQMTPARAKYEQLGIPEIDSGSKQPIIGTMKGTREKLPEIKKALADFELADLDQTKHPINLGAVGMESYEPPLEVNFAPTRNNEHQRRLLTEEERQRLDSIDDQLDINNGMSNSERPVPKAPFVTDTNKWTKLGLKYAIKEAIDRKLDRISWTTGEQQANIEGYNLAQAVDYLKLGYTFDGLQGKKDVFNLHGYKNGNLVVDEYHIDSNRLKELIGKERADKLIDDLDKLGNVADSVEMSGKGFLVGGRGMVGYYGSPRENNIGILGRVIESMLGKGKIKTTKIRGNANNHYIDITPEVQSRIEKEGQPVFNSMIPIRERIKALFRSRGHFDATTFKLVEEQQARHREAIVQTQALVDDFRKAVLEDYGRKGIRDKNLGREIDDYLQGIDRGTLKARTKSATDALRQDIDNYSNTLMSLPFLSKELKDKIGDNLGKYLTRFYERDYNQRWTDFIYKTEDGQKILDNARQFLIKEFATAGITKTPEQIEGILYDYTRPAEDIMGQAFGNPSEVRINRDVLKERKDIPPQIRALMGEFTDPLANYTRSVMKMSDMISKHILQEELRQSGMGRVFFTERTRNKDGAYTELLASRENPAYKSLTEGKHDIYTTAEIKRAFERAFNPYNNPRNAWEHIVKNYQMIMGFIRLGKTAGSPITTARNIISNPILMLVNGYWNFQDVPKSWKMDLDMQKKLTRLGVIKTSASRGELHDITSDILQDASRPQAMVRSGTDVVKAGLEKASDFYGSIDDWFKYQAWTKELARYKKAYSKELADGTISMDRLENEVADIVSRMTTNYGRVPPIIKDVIRRLPIGNFVSFPSEIMRLTFAIPAQAIKEMRDPVTRNIGITRMASFIGTMSVVSAIPTISKMLTGVTEEEEQALRQFLPSWQQNSQFIHLGKQNDGTFRTIDLSYTDPFNYVRKPLIAMLTSDNEYDLPTEAMGKAMTEMLSPYITEEILFKTMLNVRSNLDDETGKPIYNDNDTKWNKAIDIIDYVQKKTAPGAIPQLQRVYKGAIQEKTPFKNYNLPDELMGFAGQRISTIDPKVALSFRASDLQKDLNDISSLATTAQYKIEDPVSLEKRLNEVDDIYNNKLQDFRQLIDASANLGLEEKQIREILRIAKVSKINIDLLFSGQKGSLKEKSEQSKEKEQTRRQRIKEGTLPQRQTTPPKLKSPEERIR